MQKEFFFMESSRRHVLAILLTSVSKSLLLAVRDTASLLLNTFCGLKHPIKRAFLKALLFEAM